MPEIFTGIFINILALIKYLENYQGFLIVLGWGVIFYLTVRAGKIQQRNAARLEVYKEIYQLKIKLDKASIDMGLLLNENLLPFLKMDWLERGVVNTKGKNPNDLWLEHNQKIGRAVSLFTERYLNLQNSVNMWISIMPDLKKPKDILFSELDGLIFSTLWKYVDFHRNQLIENDYDWKRMDRENIKEETKKTREKFDKIAVGFVNDYIDLVHNKLIYPIFDKKKILREDFNYIESIEAETLTKEGIKKIKYKPTDAALLRREVINRKN